MQWADVEAPSGNRQYFGLPDRHFEQPFLRGMTLLQFALQNLYVADSDFLCISLVDERLDRVYWLLGLDGAFHNFWLDYLVCLDHSVHCLDVFGALRNQIGLSLCEYTFEFSLYLHRC